MAKQSKQAAKNAAPNKNTAIASGPSTVAINTAIMKAQKAQPHAEYIYVNAEGEYHLHPRPGFMKVDMSDGEVMVEKVRPIKLSNVPAAPTAPVDNDAEPEDDEPAAPNDGKEF